MTHGEKAMLIACNRLIVELSTRVRALEEAQPKRKPRKASVPKDNNIVLCNAMDAPI